MKLLPARFEIVTATVDGTLGDVGVVRIGGTAISERQAYRLAGTRGARSLAQLGFDASAVPRRARYFAFRGRRAERRAHRAQIAHLIRPYPKRIDHVGSHASPQSPQD
jgi:hypothetical protein